VSSSEVFSTSTTEKDTKAPGVYWRYSSNNKPVFNPIVFDETRLAEQNLISGQAGAGRGNTFFVTLEGFPLVLRHYRRGGLVQKLSANRYVFTGISRTRAILEFEILQRMYDMQLPVPKPFACRVIKRAATYEASIVMHRLEGSTLAHQWVFGTVSDAQWKAIGKTIARFHIEGIYHADLNAHNILIGNDGKVSLIDFDRARFRSINKNPSRETWCNSNLDRLQRSLVKLAKQNHSSVLHAQAKSPSQQPSCIGNDGLLLEVKQTFELLKSSWVSALS